MYLVPVAFFALEALPKVGQYLSERVHASIDVVGKYMESSTPGYSYGGSYTVRQKYYSDLTDEQIIERVHTKFEDKVDLAKIDSEYAKKLSRLGTERAKIAGYAFIAWVGPLLVVYAMGAAIGWVIRGFRRSDA